MTLNRKKCDRAFAKIGLTTAEVQILQRRFPDVARSIVVKLTDHKPLTATERRLLDNARYVSGRYALPLAAEQLLGGQMDKSRVTWFEDSPDVGPDCLCSVCGKPITEGVPVRVFDNETGKEARFHQPGCWNEVAAPDEQITTIGFTVGGEEFPPMDL